MSRIESQGPLGSPLLVVASPNPGSASAHVARAALSEAGFEGWTELDVARERPPEYGQALMGAVYAGDRSEQALAALALSDAYVEQLKAAPILVCAIPMHNFGVPASFKAWMDQVARPGVSFEYGASGPRGLMGPRKALVVMASGGDYSQGPAAGMEHAASHARAFLGFLGFEVSVVAVPGQAGREASQARERALAEAAGLLAAWRA